MRVVDEADEFHVAPAQSSAELDDFLWWWWKSSERQIVVKVAQIDTMKGQTNSRLSCMQGPVLEAHRTLKVAQRRVIKCKK